MFKLLRFVPPRDIPDMVLIFDKDGSVAGMQSGMPMTEFAMASPCSDSKYYLKDTINGVDVSQHTLFKSVISARTLGEYLENSICSN